MELPVLSHSAGGLSQCPNFPHSPTELGGRFCPVTVEVVQSEDSLMHCVDACVLVCVFQGDPCLGRRQWQCLAPWRTPIAGSVAAALLGPAVGAVPVAGPGPVDNRMIFLRAGDLHVHSILAVSLRKTCRMQQ